MRLTTFSPKQLDFIENANARVNIAEGAVRSGKTICVDVRWINFLKEGPPGDLFMIGKTRTSLRRNVLNTIEEMVGRRRFRWIDKSEGELSLCGRRVYVVGANDEKAESKIRGATIAGALCDEVTLYPQGFWQQLMARASVPGAQIFATTNPDSPFHWLNSDYLQNEDLQTRGIVKVWHFDLDDNLSLTEEFKASLKAMYTGLWYKRFILGLWVLAEGIIYDMFSPETHVKPAPPDLNHFIVACDYGTTNPCTFGLFGWKDKPPVYLVREYWFDSAAAGRQKTDSEYANDLILWLDGTIPEVIYVDPSAASFIAELKKRGLKVKEAENAVLDGIRFVSGMMQRGEFFIDHSCVHTLKETQAYVWDAKAQLKGEDKPLKQNDHAMDRNRYGLFSHFNRKPASVGQRPRGF